VVKIQCSPGAAAAADRPELAMPALSPLLDPNKAAISLCDRQLGGMAWRWKGAIGGNLAGETGPAPVSLLP